jgi:AraC family transcriptional regulator, regulatory protein of adaptative response / methylated-DNA-[protein]-cysteine methyltransferase
MDPQQLSDARYEAIRTRDPRAEGRFFYSVLTTGVYCRPTCASRLALRENVAFHETPEQAEQAGFRPCKRCRPQDVSQSQRHARLVAAARARIDASDAVLRLNALAAELGVSPFHLHRLFKQHLGMTPREYQAARRLRRVDEQLRERPSTVAAAIYDAGYSSSSRFYERESGALGMRPAELRQGGAGVEMRATVLDCSLGRVLVATTQAGVCAVSLGDDAALLHAELSRRFPRATLLPTNDACIAIATQVVALIDAGSARPDLPLDLIGTLFQQRVWRALREIPRGSTCSYAELARRIGAPGAARAVGAACASNPVAVAVPCHRVVRDDGELGGYRWGLQRKRALLARERET